MNAPLLLCLATSGTLRLSGSREETKLDGNV